MPNAAATEYRYNRLTWPEMNDAIAAQKLVILPTGSTEQHGRHLPLDVDCSLRIGLPGSRPAGAGQSAGAAADRLRAEPAPHRFPRHDPHRAGRFIDFCLNITKSVAYHGFKKILIVNGHGSNSPLDRPGRPQDGPRDTSRSASPRAMRRSCWRRSRRSASRR